jgi:biopolymer transport protein ExbB/TolQ
MLTVRLERSQRKPNFLVAVTSQLGWPLLWGMAASVAFYWCLDQGYIPGKAGLHRFLAGHPVEYVETAMFFIGLAALSMCALRVVQQHLTIDKVQLPAPLPGGDRADEEHCQTLLASLAKLPAKLQESYLARRYREAIQYVQRKGSADELDDQLRWLTDLDIGRQQDHYALSRLIIWAIPILGFLGTVIGITMAISSLKPEAFATEEGIETLTASLGVAFDTTTIAMAFSIVLMFAQFIIDRVEGELLAAVDERVNQTLVGRFQQLGAASDPQAASVRRMADVVVRASEELVARQAELWQDTIEAAHQQWSQLSTATAGQTQQALEKALTHGLTQHAQHLAAAEQKSIEQLNASSDRLTATLTVLAKSAEKQHAELARQGEMMAKAIEASGRVTQLQQALNQNLHALSGAKNFEDTVMSLAATIHLLISRLHGLSPAPSSVKLESLETKGKAA